MSPFPRLEFLEEENRELRERIDALEKELVTYHRGPRHLIDLRADGYTIQHLLSCWPNLFDCVYSFAAAKLPEADRPVGRYEATVDGGMLILGRKL